MNLSDIQEYYDKTGYMYRWFYSDKKSLGLHYGFWNKNTSSSEQALINVYKEIQRNINPKKGQRILDAGCGVGGASIWLAENTEARYEGITISPEQLKQAENNSRRRNVSNSTSFPYMDFHNTTFPDNTFDSIFFIESSCYADMEIVSREMMRILKPGGKIVIADFAPPRLPINEYEKKMTDYFCFGFKLPEWRTKDMTLAPLSNLGFENITFIDKTEEIKKSVNDIYLKTLITAIPFSLLRIMRIISQVEFENGYATYSQKKLYEIGLFRYGIFIATK